MKGSVDVKAFLVFVRRTFGKAVLQVMERPRELFADGESVTVSVRLEGKE